MKNKFVLLSLFGGVILFVFAAHETRAQEAKPDNPPNCQVIRVVPYPVTQQADKNVRKRIALLNLCPDNRGMVARPMLSVHVGGKFEMFEYDVVRVFKNRKEAEKYAKKNRIADANF